MSDRKPPREAMIGRIRALMAKTTANGCTEQEARAAAAAVDRLLQEYEIDLSEVEVRASAEICKVSIGAAQHSVRFAAKKIAAFCDCEVWTEGRSDLVFLGLELDTEIAEYLVMLFMRSIDREAGQYVMLNADYALRDSRAQRDMLVAFKIGVASRLGERLLELKSARDFSQRGGGQSLVVVKSALVQQGMQQLGIVLGRGAGSTPIRDQAAYAAGRSAANNVRISQGVHGSAGGSTKAIR